MKRYRMWDGRTRASRGYTLTVQHRILLQHDLAGSEQSRVGEGKDGERSEEAGGSKATPLGRTTTTSHQHPRAQHRCSSRVDGGFKVALWLRRSNVSECSGLFGLLIIHLATRSSSSSSSRLKANTDDIRGVSTTE